MVPFHGDLAAGQGTDPATGMQPTAHILRLSNYVTHDRDLRYAVEEIVNRLG